MAMPSAEHRQTVLRAGHEAEAVHSSLTADALAEKVVKDLDRDSFGSEWWRTPTARRLVDFATIGPLAVALAGISGVLQEGEDPMWVVGGVTAADALTIAREWLDADVEAAEVGAWLRAGCWSPTAARCLVDVGVRADRLLDAHGRPAYWVEGRHGEDVPVASAVADGDMSPTDAARLVTERPHQDHPNSH